MSQIVHGTYLYLNVFIVYLEFKLTGCPILYLSILPPNKLSWSWESNELSHTSKLTQRLASSSKSIRLVENLLKLFTNSGPSLHGNMVGCYHVFTTSAFLAVCPWDACFKVVAHSHFKQKMMMSSRVLSVLCPASVVVLHNSSSYNPYLSVKFELFFT